MSSWVVKTLVASLIQTTMTERFEIKGEWFLPTDKEKRAC
jgi:hypothetical protein